MIDGTKVAGTLADFPILIEASHEALIGAAPTELLFTAGDGTTKLAHELERFDAATGTVTAWVRVPMLDPATTLFIYYGNPAAAPQDNPSDVWIGGYAAVYHMSETPNPGIEVRDSTTHARHAATQGMMASDQMAGKIGGSLQFDSNNRVTAASFAIGSTFTYEAWVQPVSSTNRWRCIVNNDPLYNRWFGLRDNDIDFWDNNSERILGANVVPGASWYHVAVTYDGTQLRAYNNGTAGTPVTVTLPSAPSAPLQIGYTAALSNEWFQGRIDEVRVSSVSRSDAYVSTSFNNQSSPATFATLEAVESCR